MDRNTLLAFFLIALVLLFTPKYMEIFYPPAEETVDSVPPSRNSKNPSENLEKTNVKSKVLNTPSLPFSSESGTIEKLSTIETSLYKAVVSSRGGGTIKAFFVSNYLGSDSLPVNVVNEALSYQNLLVSIKDLDGNPVDLSGPWLSKNTSSYQSIKNEETLEYSLEVAPGVFIKKSLVFKPDDYSILVKIHSEDIKNVIHRDMLFSWGGGLSSTEKDTKDDKTYFNSYVYQGGELEELKTKMGEEEKKSFNGETSWCAIRTKYFVAALIPETPTDIRSASLIGAGDSLETHKMSFVLDPHNQNSFVLYLGPLEYDRIKSLGAHVDEIMDFGWAFIRPISKGVLYALTRMHEHIPNYGFVLIVFSFLVKVLVFPLTKKSYQSTAAMQKIQPQVNSLREKYKNNPQKLNQATMKLYKERGVNPLGGCLPMLLQMPLLFALFIVFRTTIELRNEPFVFWIKDLSSPDVIFSLPFSIPIYGSNVAFLPILMVISTFIQQKMMSGGVQQPQQKMMQYFMTGFFFLIFNTFPSGLNLYYTLFNVLTIAQQKLIPGTQQST
tara:strand:+ start:680 stop:2341 length:1662 start_codon:yes stop_codon:yes gene_type:complete